MDPATPRHSQAQTDTDEMAFVNEKGRSGEKGGFDVYGEDDGSADSQFVLRYI